MARFALVLVGLVGLASCNILDIIAPARARAGETIDVRVNVGVATDPNPFSLCVERPDDWTVGTRNFTIEREPQVSGPLATVNTPDTDYVVAEEARAGHTWTCFDGGTSIAGDRGYADIQLTTGAAGSYLLRFALVIHDGITIVRVSTHAITIDGVPRYDANAVGLPTQLPYDSIAYGNGKFVMAGWNNSVVVRDGDAQTTHTTTVADALHAVAFGAGQFVAVGEDRAIIASPDGVTWSATLVPLVDNVPLYVVFRGANRFIAAGMDGTIMQSTDGTVWTDAAQIGLDATTTWRSGAAGGSSEVLIGTTADATVIAVADSGGAFTGRTITNVFQPTAVAYTASTGWVFPLLAGAVVRSTDLVNGAASPLMPSDNNSAAFVAAGNVYVTSPSSIYRVTATDAFEIGKHGSVEPRSGADDGQRILMIGSTGNANEGQVLRIDLARAGVDATSLDFGALGEERTFNVRNDGRGAMYVGLATSSDVTASGCEEPVAAGASCAVTVTLAAAGNGEVTVTTSAAFDASHVVALTYSGSNDDLGGNAEEDDGCASLPGSPLALLALYFCLSFFSSRTRSTRLLGRDRPF